MSPGIPLFGNPPRMYRVELRKFESTVLAPTTTDPAGFDEHTHEIVAGGTRTEPGGAFRFGPDENLGPDEIPSGEHSHAIRPGAPRTEPGGFDDHTHGMPMAKRAATAEIIDGEIMFLSLVDDGANESVPLLKGKKLHRVEAIAKLAKDGLLYNLVYGPDIVDFHGEFASKEGVQRLAHKFIPNMIGSGIDVMHNCKPVDRKDAHLCESFIIQKNGDDRFQGVTVQGRVIEDTTELAGWWASVIKLNAPHLRKPFEDGVWRGVSMYGTALMRDVQKSTDFTHALASRLGLNPQPLETDMNEQELAKAMATALSPLVDKIEALTKSADGSASNDPTPEVTAKTKEIEFEGDPTNLDDVEAHEEKVFRASLNFGKSADLAKWKTYLAKKAEAAKSAEGDESDELVKAREIAKVATARVAELAKASNQGTEDVKGSENADERQTRIRKFAKDTARGVLRSQGVKVED